MNTIAKTMMLTTAAAVLLASAGPLGATAEAANRHAHHRYVTTHRYVAPQHKGAVQYGNNTRDNGYGGVYGEYAPQPQ